MVKIIDIHFQGHPETIAAFLVETSEGPALVETGPHSALPWLEQGLRGAGYDIEDVKHVFLTHIHLDHGGAAWVFAEKGATVYVHPSGERHLQNPEKLLASARQIYQENMDRLWGQMNPVPAERIRVVKHNEKIPVGNVRFRALHTPGHAVHHIAWQVNDILFTGDVGGIKIGNGIVVPPCPPPDINIEDWLNSLKLIRTRRFRELYLTHFGKVDDAKSHLRELQGRLLNWANWIKPYYENETEQSEITPLFQAYVARQLEAGGITGEDLEKYENANPAWMSVAGLMRYWRKKAEAGS